MDTKKKLNNMTAAFNCRKFKPDTPWHKREMVAEGERIEFSVGLTKEELKQYTAESYGFEDFANFSEKTGKYYVSFKVFPKNCKAYNSKAQQIAFPPYALLDGEYFLINFDYNVKHGDPKKFELNGCYVGGIQFVKPLNVSFEEVEGDDSWLAGTKVDNENIFDKPTPTQEAPAPAPDDLPFSPGGSDELF